MLPIGIASASSPVIFFQPLLFLLLLPLPLINEELLIVICLAVFFIVGFNSIIQRDPFLLWDFCDLDSPSIVVHIPRQIIVWILFGVHLEINNKLFEGRNIFEVSVEEI